MRLMNPKNIIVMGGSFNPPTIAHLKSMQKALDAVNAERTDSVPESAVSGMLEKTVLPAPEEAQAVAWLCV